VQISVVSMLKYSSFAFRSKIFTSVVRVGYGELKSRHLSGLVRVRLSILRVVLVSIRVSLVI